MTGDLFLEAKFLLLKSLYRHGIGYGPAHLRLDLPLKTRVFILQGADVRSFHGWSSFQTRRTRVCRLGIMRMRHNCHGTIIGRACEAP